MREIKCKKKNQLLYDLIHLRVFSRNRGWGWDDKSEVRGKANILEIFWFYVTWLEYCQYGVNHCFSLFLRSLSSVIALFLYNYFPTFLTLKVKVLQPPHPIPLWIRQCSIKHEPGALPSGQHVAVVRRQSVVRHALQLLPHLVFNFGDWNAISIALRAF